MAEIEERLQLLRRRLNIFHAQHVAYLGGSGLTLIAALLLIAGLRASPQAFGVILWLSVAVALGCVGYALPALVRRWIDVTHVAGIADREGGLADRLTTLISLPSRPQPSRLAPLLVTQALDLGERWRPERIAPRRVPRSIFLLLASLLLLVLTAFVQRRDPDAATDPETESPAQLGHDAPQQLPQRPELQARDDRTEEMLDATGPRAGVDGGLPPGAMPDAGSYDGSAPLEGTQLSEMPDRLQDAIRRAFNAEPLDSPRQLGSGAEAQGASGQREGREGARDGKEAGRGAASAAGERQARGEAAEQPVREPRANRDEKGSGERAGQRRDSGAAHGDLSGSSPSAGDGPGSVPPIGSLADLGKAGAAAATFKLTITSFLAAVESQGLPQRDAGAGTAPARGANGGGKLSDRQLNDDVLRKSEIPPQYEDVVRRAYSAGK